MAQRRRVRSGAVWAANAARGEQVRQDAARDERHRHVAGKANMRGASTTSWSSRQRSAVGVQPEKQKATPWPKHAIRERELKVEYK